MSLDATKAYPLSPEDSLKSAFVGKSLQDVPTPALIIDRFKAEHNCKLMLEAVKDIGVGFRAHVKTHKTTELTRMQVGEKCKDVRLIVSTIIEAEHLVPLLLEYKSKGAKVNVLYGVPIGPAQVGRLAKIGKELGPGSITVMIDHPEQLPEAVKFNTISGFPIAVFIKADAGSHRAGINPSSIAMAELVEAVTAREEKGDISLKGFYSHAGHSYAGSSPSDAMRMLQHEISTCQSAVQHIDPKSRQDRETLIFSVGASPTVLSIQNLKTTDPSSEPAAKSLADLITNLNSSEQSLELHAGVYPLLDMQQRATDARPLPITLSPTIKSFPIALSILTQVHSLYPPATRSSKQHQALIAAGSLALGREPCKSYPGWGVLSDWNLDPSFIDSKPIPPIIVSSISQEHGILSHSDPSETSALPLAYGQRLRIYPNHACIACAQYSFYFIVDSSEGEGDQVVDMWMRWRGW